ncbi:hypothetical protein DY000_02059255 [Brassica cretica]|uniref:Uncharacterized protein n=1 Tax=Brassica cretica TaxID=69181 RepID=A0ABQ7AV84_BRACR|nr:hypothetical protein DY000_02059255 [Brassica cretica]
MREFTIYRTGYKGFQDSRDKAKHVKSIQEQDQHGTGCHGEPYPSSNVPLVRIVRLWLITNSPKASYILSLSVSQLLVPSHTLYSAHFNKGEGRESDGKALVTYSGAPSIRCNDHDFIKRSEMDALIKMLKDNGNIHGYSFVASMVAKAI